MPILVDIQNLEDHCRGAGFPGVEKDPGTDSPSFTRAEHDPPIVGAVFLQEKEFELTPRALILTPEPGRYHFGVVHHQQISRPKMSSDVMEHLVLDGSGGTVVKEEAGASPVWGGGLGDQPVGQGVVEIRSVHLFPVQFSG